MLPAITAGISGWCRAAHFHPLGVFDEGAQRLEDEDDSVQDSAHRNTDTSPSCKPSALNTSLVFQDSADDVAEWARSWTADPTASQPRALACNDLRPGEEQDGQLLPSASYDHILDSRVSACVKLQETGGPEHASRRGLFNASRCSTYPVAIAATGHPDGGKQQAYGWQALIK
ncbi:hypothetical protein ACVBEG_27805 [Pseudomonas sp. GG8]